MHFVILGSGAVGGYFGARLAQAGYKVTFIARGEHLAAMQNKGLTINSINGDLCLNKVTAVEDTKRAGAADVIFICVKTFQLEAALVQIRSITKEHTRIIPLLNGVDAAQRVIDFGIPAQQVCGGLAKIISRKTAPGVICHTGGEPHITLGELHSPRDRSGNFSGASTQLQQIIQCYEKAGISAGIAKNIELALWRKFIFVAAWGALAANGTLAIGQLRCGLYRQQLMSILHEYASIARTVGVAITDGLVAQTVKFIDALPEHSQTSMQQDINNNQRSEFESLVAYPYFLARTNKLTTPVLDSCYFQLCEKLAVKPYAEK